MSRCLDVHTCMKRVEQTSRVFSLVASIRITKSAICGTGFSFSSCVDCGKPLHQLFSFHVKVDSSSYDPDLSAAVQNLLSVFPFLFVIHSLLLAMHRVEVIGVEDYLSTAWLLSPHQRVKARNRTTPFLLVLAY